MNIQNILKKYDKENITIGVLGGHSALDVCSGAKSMGFRTVCVACKGREKTYEKYYKTRKINDENIGCIDEVIVVDDFKDIIKQDIQTRLREMNTIFIHNRYFWVYCDFNEIENEFEVPIYGSRSLLKLEERNIKNNQYYLLEKAGIRIPKIFKTPVLGYDRYINSISFNEPPNEDMHIMTLTKVNNATRTYERENFIASSWEEWLQIARNKILNGEVTQEGLNNSVIEEFVLGAQINFNFFNSIIKGEIELIGTDMRRQTSLDGWLRLPAYEQIKLLQNNKQPYYIETGHVAITCKESILEKAFIASESFVKTCREEAGELIGPFALQGAIITDGKKEELVVFDVSLRIPGSPGISATPYMKYLYGDTVSTGERIALEIQEAIENDRLDEILT